LPGLNFPQPMTAAQYLGDVFIKWMEGRRRERGNLTKVTQNGGDTKVDS